MVTAISRDYNVQLINANNSCGLNGLGFQKCIAEVIRPLFAEGVTNSDFVNLTQKDVSEWLSTPALGDPLEQPSMCCQSDLGINIPGMAFVSVQNFNRADIYNVDTNPLGQLRVGYTPGNISEPLMSGKATFLGGSGLAITRKAKYKNTAWKFMLLFSRTDFSGQLNMDMGSFSPYYSAMAAYLPWSNPKYDTIRAQYLKAVPLQYPQG